MSFWGWGMTPGGRKRGDGNGGGGGGGDAHPLVDSGFDWIDVEDTSRLYSDLAGTTNIDGNDDDVIKYMDGLGANSRRWKVVADSTHWLYSTGGGARGIGGKPIIYSSSTGQSFNLRNAADDGFEIASNYFTGRPSAFVLVARRRTTDTGRIATAGQGGTTRPGSFALLSTTEGTWDHYNSSGFRRDTEFAWGTEEAVICVRWDEASAKFEVLFNNGEWIVPSSASDTSWSPLNQDIILEALADVADIATFGIHDGDKTREELETLAAALMTYYGLS